MRPSPSPFMEVIGPKRISPTPTARTPVRRESRFADSPFLMKYFSVHPAAAGISTSVVIILSIIVLCLLNAAPIGQRADARRGSPEQDTGQWWVAISKHGQK